MKRHTKNLAPSLCNSRSKGEEYSDRRLPDGLILWRTVHPTAIGGTSHEALHEALADCKRPTQHQSWQDALDGDTAAAIRIAMIVSGLCGPSHPMTDTAASALFLHALVGDPAAIAAFACMLRSRSASHPSDARLASLADAWSQRSAPFMGHQGL